LALQSGERNLFSFTINSLKRNPSTETEFTSTMMEIGASTIAQNVSTAYSQENHIRTFSPHHFQVIVVSLSNCSATYPAKMDIMFSGGHTSTIATHPAPQPLTETEPDY
jgi:hypothetical protein